MRLESLRAQFITWLLIPLALLLAVDAWFTHERARAAADTAFDRTLLTSVKAISGGVRMIDGEIQVDIPYLSLDMFETETSGPVFYRVSLSDGTPLTGYEDLPLPKAAQPFYKPTYYNTTYRGHGLRVAAIMHPVYDISSKANRVVWIAVAETTRSREEIAQQILVGSLLQESILACLALVAVWAGVAFAIRPLNKLSAHVRQRSLDDLCPLDETGAPQEIRPLIRAINQYTQRMQQMLVARRRFFSDATHQLKTPLAVLQAQTELLLKDTHGTAFHEPVKHLHGTTRQAAQGVVKLLSLSRLEPDSGDPIVLGPVDLHAIARRVALDWAPVSDQHSIDLGFEGVGEIPVQGQAELLSELIGNLIDNAVKYCDPGARITLRVGLTGRLARLQVIDTGPGIRAEEREKVFKRFYRSGGHAAPGSGLGLSIVREIVRLHNATVALSGTEGGGLTATIEFPLLESSV
ncbi:signal transduction histidine kinase [Burkholderia sp. CF099]|nr:signal transduction histidine kinase [Burkholderia sp. CF099]